MVDAPVKEEVTPPKRMFIDLTLDDHNENEVHEGLASVSLSQHSQSPPSTSLLSPLIYESDAESDSVWEESSNEEAPVVNTNDDGMESTYLIDKQMPIDLWLLLRLSPKCSSTI